MDFYFDDYNRQLLHRRTPLNQGRRRQVSLDDSWQETAMRLKLPTYSRVLSDGSEESESTVMDVEKPAAPIHFDPKNAKKAAKGMNFYPDNVQLSEADLPRPPLDYEQFDSSLHVDDTEDSNNNIGNSGRGDATPPAAPPSSPRGEQQRRSSSRRASTTQQPFQPPYPLEQQPQQLYTGMMKAPLSLIAEQFGRSTSGPFFPGCFEQQAFEYRQHNSILYQVYPNTPSPVPASIAAIASPVWSGDRTGDTLKKTGHHGQLISNTRTAVNVQEKERGAAAAKPSPQQQQQQARLHMIWSGNQTDGASGNTGTIGWNTELIELANNNNNKERKEQQQHVELLGCLDTVLMNGQILWSRQQQQKSTSNEGGKKKKN